MKCWVPQHKEVWRRRVTLEGLELESRPVLLASSTHTPAPSPPATPRVVCSHPRLMVVPMLHFPTVMVDKQTRQSVIWNSFCMRLYTLKGLIDFNLCVTIFYDAAVSEVAASSTKSSGNRSQVDDVIFMMKKLE